MNDFQDEPKQDLQEGEVSPNGGQQQETNGLNSVDADGSAFGQNHDGPVPPPNWQGYSQVPGNPQGSQYDYGYRGQEAPWVHKQDPEGGLQPKGSSNRLGLRDKDIARFLVARRYLLVGEVMAIVSILFGGILLNLLAFAVVGIGARSMHIIAQDYKNEEGTFKLMRRFVIMSIVVCAIAFAANSAMIAATLPMLNEIMQNGGATGASTGSIWG